MGSGCSECFGENPAERGAPALGSPRPPPRAARAQGPQGTGSGRGQAGRRQRTPQSWGHVGPVAPARGCRLQPHRGPAGSPPNLACHRPAPQTQGCPAGSPCTRWALAGRCLRPPHNFNTGPCWPLPSPVPTRPLCSPVSTTAPKLVPELRSPPCYLPTFPVPWYQAPGPASLHTGSTTRTVTTAGAPGPGQTPPQHAPQYTKSPV